MTYETYHLIYIVAAIAAGVMLAVSAVLFALLRIPQVIGYLSGSTAKKAIADIHRQNVGEGGSTGNIRSNQKKEKKHTPQSSGRNKETGRQKPERKMVPETAVLDRNSAVKANAPETAALDRCSTTEMATAETAVLNRTPEQVAYTEAGATMLLSREPSAGTYAGETMVLNRVDQRDGSASCVFQTEEEIVFIHTDEVIPG